MKRIPRTALILLTALMLFTALAEGYSPARGNVDHFADLLNHLVSAYESPSERDDERLEADLNGLLENSQVDYEIGRQICDHWRRVYSSDYPLYIHHRDVYAAALTQAGLQDSPSHAIVVLGYELKNGEMTGELVGRCDAAAAVARSLPGAQIFLSGGATGKNNPRGHTEAGLMRDYLVDTCGIDPGRIHTDERAMTTMDNAVNTYAMMRDQGIESMTIVTSTYHQQWGQAVYNAVGALYRQRYGYDVEIILNYCYDIEPEHDLYKTGDRLAARQIARILGLPDRVIDKMKK